MVTETAVACCKVRTPLVLIWSDQENNELPQDGIFCAEIGTPRLLNAMCMLIVTACVREF